MKGATALGFLLLLVSAADANINVEPLLEVAAAMNNPPELMKSWKGDNPCRGGRSGSWAGVGCDATATVVTWIDFMGRGFSGSISPHMADLTSLVQILLSGNRLQGSIPESLTTLPSLQLLDVSNNDLSGRVPQFALNVTLKLSGNHFDGQ